MLLPANSQRKNKSKEKTILINAMLLLLFYTNRINIVFQRCITIILLHNIRNITT